jgi:DNA-binding NtrC family response regulator
MSSDDATLPVLIVDDEIESVNSIQLLLQSSGLRNTEGCIDGRQVPDLLAQREFGVILLDLTMPGVSGETLLEEITTNYPYIPVIIITASDKAEIAVRCIRAGAFDYLVKPVTKNYLISAVSRAIELRELRKEYDSFRQKVIADRLEFAESFSEIITNNSKILSLFRYIETIAVTNRPVLISGETGVGKELFAKAIHNASGLKGPFVAVNVAGLDDNVFSDTLFGHTRGAFTGAEKERLGLVEKAADGTLFLDEIGDLDQASQVKLLRFLQEREYFPLGADLPKATNARVLVATNRDLHSLQKEGKFRNDLYYRLQTHSIDIPPLRGHLDDLPLLVEHFLKQASKSLGRKKNGVPRQIYTLLANYSFPGNVRELESMIFDAVSANTAKMLSLKLIETHISKHQSPTGTLVQEGATVNTNLPFALFQTLPLYKEAPALLIQEALKRTEGNKSAAARLLGMSLSGLKKAIQRMEV